MRPSTRARLNGFPAKMYELLYHPRASKRLKTIHPIDRKKVLSKLEDLASNPKDPSLNIKKLVNTTRSYRVRVGNIRVIFEIEEESKKIYIWEVEYRGSVSY